MQENVKIGKNTIEVFQIEMSLEKICVLTPGDPQSGDFNESYFQTKPNLCSELVKAKLNQIKVH